MEKMMSKIDLELMIDTAITEHRGGNHQAAGKIYLDILRQNPRQPDANNNMGLLCVELGEPSMAVNFFKNAIESNHDVIEYWENCIDTLIGLGDPQSASVALKKASDIGHRSEKLSELQKHVENMSKDLAKKLTGN